MTVLIPVLGYMLIFNERIIPYLGLTEELLGRQLHSIDPIHVSWRLLFIYFGLCLLALGSILYQIFCPPEIKRHATAVDYTAATREHVGDIVLGRMESRLAHEADSMEEFAMIRDHTRDRANKYDDKSHRDKIYEQYWPDVLDMNYRLLDGRYYAARIATFIFYVTGFVVLAIPSMDVFFRVSRLALDVLATSVF